MNPKDLEAGRSRFCVSARILSLFSMIFGVTLIVSWYLNIPALVKVYPDWVPMPFEVVPGVLLVVVGVFLALVTGLAINIWQKGENLQKNLEDETNRRKKAEKGLAHAQEIVKMGNWELEFPSKDIRWSDEVYRILDCSPKNTRMTFQRFLRFVHPDDRNFVGKEIQKALNQGTAFNFTNRIVRQDGSIRIVKQRSEVYLDQNGSPAQILGTLQDVTDQKKSENLTARLGRIIDRSFNEVYAFDAETLKFVKVNLAARLNLHYNMEELYKMTPVDLLSEFTQEQFEELIALLKRGLESVTAFETVHKRKDGTLYPVGIRLQLLRTELRPQFVAIVQDITDRKKVENLFSRAYQELDRQVHERTSDLTKLNSALQREVDEQKKAMEALDASEHRLIEIMNNVIDGIITIDEAGIVRSFNRAAEQLFGFEIEEALGQNIDALMSGVDETQCDQYFKNLLQSKKSADLGLRRVVTARKKDGTIFSVELTVNETVIGGQRMFTGLLRELVEKEETKHELIEILKPTTKS